MSMINNTTNNTIAANNTSFVALTENIACIGTSAKYIIESNVITTGAFYFVR